MFGRISHYFQKAKLRIKRDGFRALMTETLSFLIRRKFFFEFAIEAFEYQVLSRFRNPDSTILRFPKQEEITGNRVLLYATYDASSRVQPYVISQLQAFHAAQYEIVFVSTSPNFPEEELRVVKSFCKIVVHRKNEGYDFGSWRVGYDLIANLLPKLESLAVMNDSCLGPFFEIGPILKKMRDEEGAAYGISKSLEIAEHIQSYFYHFGRTLIQSGVVEEFFERIRILNTKWGIVRYYEIGGSKFLTDHEIPLRALIDPSDIGVAQKLKEYSMTQPLGEPLATEWVKLRMSPFYKRSNVTEGLNIGT